jgi:hypothetical protein
MTVKIQTLDKEEYLNKRKGRTNNYFKDYKQKEIKKDKEFLLQLTGTTQDNFKLIIEDRQEKIDTILNKFFTNPMYNTEMNNKEEFKSLLNWYMCEQMEQLCDIYINQGKSAFDFFVARMITNNIKSNNSRWYRTIRQTQNNNEYNYMVEYTLYKKTNQEEEGGLFEQLDENTKDNLFQIIDNLIIKEKTNIKKSNPHFYVCLTILQTKLKNKITFRELAVNFSISPPCAVTYYNKALNYMRPKIAKELNLKINK